MIRALLLASVATVAIWQIGVGASVHAKAWLGQVLLERAWARADERADGRREPVAPWPGAVSHPVARLRVPALAVDHLVLEGADTPVLAWGPGMETGPNGHRMIAAHRDTHFRFLQHVEIGQRFELELAGGQTEYWRVVDQSIVDSRTTQLDLGFDARVLTLVTCYPFDRPEAGGPMRLLTSLEPVEAPDGPSPES
jgi:sortase A